MSQCGIGVSPSKATSSISTHFCANVLSLGTCANRILGLQNFKNLSGFSPESVKIYPSRNTEQRDIYPHRTLLKGEQVHRVYLNELGDIRQLPLWVALMVLTTVEEEQAPAAARGLLIRTREEDPQPSSRAIIEMITTIMVYKFEKLSRMEVESMLGITLKETRVYQEIKEEGREEGREEATVNVIIRLLTKRFGKISEEMRSSISSLPLPVLEDLSEALLDFTSFADIQTWLKGRVN